MRSHDIWVLRLTPNDLKLDHHFAVNRYLEVDEEEDEQEEEEDEDYPRNIFLISVLKGGAYRRISHFIIL